jgi:hypothetical protein
MLNIIQNAGLSVAEFATIVGVSRIAVHNWTSKPPRSKPHKLIRPRVDAALALLRKKVDSDDLPLSEGLDREARATAVSKLKDQIRD